MAEVSVLDLDLALNLSAHLLSDQVEFLHHRDDGKKLFLQLAPLLSEQSLLQLLDLPFAFVDVQTALIYDVLVLTDHYLRLQLFLHINS